MTLSKTTGGGEGANQTVDSVFSSRYEQTPVPKWRLPEKEIPKDAAYQTISDELMLDGNPRLDLASFCTTWMEPECDKLIMQSLSKNYIDMDEYPITTELQDRCVNMIAHLFHAPLEDGQQAIGAGTVGSSEAVMLGGLAMKRKWQLQRKAAGKPYDKPNFVCGANVHVVWEKFASYFEVELRDVKLREDYYVMDAEKAVELVDENTILVCTTFGSTYNGQFEDVKKLNDLLDKKNAENGWNIPIHVDAASGGFVAPFVYPEIEWDFRLKWVKSINVSGHKYGLVYPGIGCVIWRSKEELPEELVFHINYLGTDQPTFTLNFSKGASQVIAQYYQMIRLGFEGYKKVITNCVENAKLLSDAISAIGRFKIISKPVGVPLVAFSLLDESEHDEHEISDGLRRYGWTVPAYTMAPDAQNVTLLRVVVREDMSHGLVDRLVTDIKRVLATLDAKPSKLVQKVADSIKDGDEVDIEKAKKEVRGKQSHDDSKHVSAFDEEHNKKRHFNVHKTHGLRKSNGVC
jgi:glutamate decarboxylase